ncbi:hypothetical protein [Clostridium beijerinckii]|jgi:hypothetical protein|uniref:hypothetical protein n=1 Tax=Clostridium beijerinckii TaxID=1520 RepID=UPI00156DDE20|nr:hypothetical protein [Clostridium beijerinckii]NRU52406.1 hypothetical protein [Clostridium beijerinckii]NYC69149.1 hypothetical protein [Clostridium beijerinckii]NYC91897.1 hypothetical protein [Clostridium beijerinckii]NYC91915.1 hypothetical protein [Clostridium beijerinckii]
MLKGTISYEIEDKVGAGVGSIHELIKDYMLIGIKYGADNFDYIQYRNHELFIKDNGYKDAVVLEEEIRQQVIEINRIEDGE